MAARAAAGLAGSLPAVAVRQKDWGGEKVVSYYYVNIRALIVQGGRGRETGRRLVRRDVRGGAGGRLPAGGAGLTEA